MQVLDAMQVGQRKSEAFSLLGRDELIHIDCMNRLLTLDIATTVAKGFPASGKTGEKDIGHDRHPRYNTSFTCTPERYLRPHRPSLRKEPCPLSVDTS